MVILTPKISKIRRCFKNHSVLMDYIVNNDHIDPKISKIRRCYKNLSVLVDYIVNNGHIDPKISKIRRCYKNHSVLVDNIVNNGHIDPKLSKIRKYFCQILMIHYQAIEKLIHFASLRNLIFGQIWGHFPYLNVTATLF